MTEHPVSSPAGAGGEAGRNPNVSPSSLSDGELARLACRKRESKEGKEAFSELVKRHQKWAVTEANRILNNLDDAQEAVQDAFLKVWKKLVTLEQPEAFMGFLKTTLTRGSFNYRRRRALRNNPGLSDAVLEGDINPKLQETGRGVLSEDNIRSTRPSRSMENKELGMRVTDAMERLPEQERLALQLFAIEGLPQKEVAVRLGCSEGMVKWHVSQARKKLKEMLDDLLSSKD
ncbi:MAG: RNA polymerase sigma factor [Tepidisphaerales bacterium]